MVTVMKSSQEQVSLRFSFKRGGGSQSQENRVLSFTPRVAGPIFHSKRLLE
jgi:hypothetical protein